MKLSAVLFKQEKIDKVYRMHFIVYSGRGEATRFALEFKKKPSRKLLSKKINLMLEEVAKNLPPQISRVVFEKEIP